MSIEPRFYHIEKQGPIVTWKFSNPPQNLASLETVDEFNQLLEEFENDPELCVGIITSATPGTFIQHFDVSTIEGWAEELDGTAGGGVVAGQTENEEPKTINEITSKPVICAINGPVEGGGCELALYCDFRFMSRDTFIGQSEIHAGFPPGYGIPRMLQLIGLGKTLELCMTGRRVYADEAERIGLVTRACNPDELETEVMQLALYLASKSPVALSLIKKITYGCCDLNLHDGLALNRDLFKKGIQSDYARMMMRLYLMAGQNADRLSKAFEEAGGDPDKVEKLLRT